MKAKDLRERSVEDLRELEKSLAKDTFQNRFKNFTNRLDDTSVINKTKRDLARVKTILAQRVAADEKQASTKNEAK
ncbi:MAG: 50S ribosomal protein L29 [Myxococcales bacterium 68-20]|nr:50S ribosomal protein L29 [Myxococcales bacterium]OJY21135.1 MAG: 50S ribosomal protein L29 [Myxococcales bacterium 68-20]